MNISGAPSTELDTLPAAEVADVDTGSVGAGMRKDILDNVAPSGMWGVSDGSALMVLAALRSAELGFEGAREELADLCQDGYDALMLGILEVSSPAASLLDTCKHHTVGACALKLCKRTCCRHAT